LPAWDQQDFPGTVINEGRIRDTGGTIMLTRDRNHDDELGPDSAGQSGDLQGLSDVADADSESVKDLVEEGNAFEAEVVDGVENAEDPDVAEVTTREVPEDDVPEEYRDAS
jgi:hypothetical protein